MSPTRFSCLREGVGATFPLNDNFKYVGTFWCNQCVGVYLLLDDKKFFCAHISASSGCRQPAHLVSPVDGEHIRKDVVTRLDIEYRNNAWNREHPKFGSKIVAVCPEVELKGIESETPMRRTGWYVLRGIRDFLLAQAVALDVHSAKEDKSSDRSEFLKERATVLNAEATNFELDTASQGFIVDNAKVLNGDEAAVYKFRNDPEDGLEHKVPADIGDFEPVWEPFPEEWMIASMEDRTKTQEMAKFAIESGFTGL